MTGPDRWCSVRFDGSDQQGWVAGRFLTEAAAPATAAVPAGGPVGNGVPFGATGEVPCATATGQPIETAAWLARDETSSSSTLVKGTTFSSTSAAWRRPSSCRQP